MAAESDILRKSLIVILVASSVWAGCALVRWLVDRATGWLFTTSSPPAAVACGVCFLVSHRFNIFHPQRPAF